jgi:hypothetical protein
MTLHRQPGPAGARAGGGGRGAGRGWSGLVGVTWRLRWAAGAETVARSITDPDRQAQALAAVAAALAAKGNMRQARHVAPAACAVGRWTTVLRLVLSLEPSAVRVLTDP